ncbi:MAG: hypothetical protein EA374_07415 [Acholeplasmatales bacterium]|nr:MAG: hypothetical protein EA374_07415 [Acholeplasmatales bacterium]
MIFDFKTNRLIFGVGMGILFALTLVLVAVFQVDLFTILLLSAVFILMINILMKRVANRAYQHVHQLLFIYCDAESYLEHVLALYKRGSRARKIFTGVKWQNVIMAHVFTGDFDEAEKQYEAFKETFGQMAEGQGSMRFSHLIIEALLAVFQHQTTRLEAALERLEGDIDRLKGPSQQYVRENPYSVYYMIRRAQAFLESDDLDTHALVHELQEANEFLRTCLLYILLKHDKIDETVAQPFTRMERNTLFYLDTQRKF